MFTRAIVVLTLGWGLVGCQFDWRLPEGKTLECQSATDCPGEQTCHAEYKICVDRTNPICGDGRIDDGELCDAGPSNSNDWVSPYTTSTPCNATCTGLPPHCGDGEVTHGELCDQGAEENTTSYATSKTCNTTCDGYAPYCGDHNIDANESCDQGVANTAAYSLPGVCNQHCDGFAPHCGDGEKTHFEACDDGEQNSSEYSAEPNQCNATCSGYRPYCGDGIAQAGERCDDGPTNMDGYNNDGDLQCNASCSGIRPYCGDAQIHPSELCDTGVLNTQAYGPPGICDTTCLGFAPHCGDAVLSEEEICDAGDANTDAWAITGGRCNLNCNGFAPYCGDGEITHLELCDAGVGVNTDSYSTTTTCNLSCDGYAPYCGDNDVNGPEVCDHGPANTGAYSLPGVCNNACSGPAPFCGDGDVTDLEFCDDGSEQNSEAYGQVATACNGSCTAYRAHCGDGTVQLLEGESCDDGNAVDTDNCPSGPQGTCGEPFCGDALVRATAHPILGLAEECDEGAQNSEATSGGCRTDCRLYFCGDGVVDPGETCDDGNDDLTDGCPSGPLGTCAPASCGDGFLWHGVEACDNGVANSDTEANQCRTTCNVPHCGDAVRDTGESCDDGALGSDVCSSECLLGTCGDGFVQAPEECDDGDDNPWNECTNACTLPACGDSVVQPGEACDDGNIIETDACSSNCTRLVEMNHVPGNTFAMGCDAAVVSECEWLHVRSNPLHIVSVDGFYMDIYEVTVSEFSACKEAGVCSHSASGGLCNFTYSSVNGQSQMVPTHGENQPMNCVDWENAQTYCQWRNKRLPTEAEWELAAGGPTYQQYPWGDGFVHCKYAVTASMTTSASRGCGLGSTWPVGNKPEGASPYGILNMGGNVAEWVSDFYQMDYYSETPLTNPTGPLTGSDHTVRGSSYYALVSGSYLSRVFERVPGMSSTHPAVARGFRCAVDENLYTHP